MANAVDSFGALSMYYIVATNCFLKIASCTSMIFDAWACTMFGYSLASLIMSLMLTISCLISLFFN